MRLSKDKERPQCGHSCHWKCIRNLIVYSVIMARRTELQGICNDLLSTFVSRNNDLNGYWALGQYSAWLEEEQISTIKVSVVGTKTINEKPQISITSQYFSEILQNMLSGHKLYAGWVADGYITIESVNTRQLRCSVGLISDLGRKFQSTRSLAVSRHDPSRELRRHFNNWVINNKREKV